MQKFFGKKKIEIRRVQAPMGDNGVPIISDPNGSYTGRCVDPYEMPVQDADDL